jgi:hypothetical protein
MLAASTPLTKVKIVPALGRVKVGTQGRLRGDGVVQGDVPFNPVGASVAPSRLAVRGDLYT